MKIKGKNFSKIFEKENIHTHACTHFENKKKTPTYSKPLPPPPPLFSSVFLASSTQPTADRRQNLRYRESKRQNPKTNELGLSFLS
jgi:hypothetical protein